MLRDFTPGVWAVKGSRNKNECRPWHDAELKPGMFPVGFGQISKLDEVGCSVVQVDRELV